MKAADVLDVHQRLGWRLFLVNNKQTSKLRDAERHYEKMSVLRQRTFDI